MLVFGEVLIFGLSKHVDGYIVDRHNTLKLSLCRIAYFAMYQATKLEHGRIVMRILGLPWFG